MRHRRYREKGWERALREFIDNNPDALWNHGREDDVDKVNEFVPPQGAVDATFPAVERFRKLQNIYHDMYNNGGCNCIDMNDRNNRAHWGVSRSTLSTWRRRPDLLERRAVAALDAALEELKAGGFIE